MANPKNQRAADPVQALDHAQQATVSNADRPVRADEATGNADRPVNRRAVEHAGDRPAAETGAIDIADLPEAPKAGKDKADADGPTDVAENEGGFEPTPIYNPFIPHERFRVGEGGGWHRFASGRYVAHTEGALQAALAALAYHKQGKGEDYVGDDQKREYVCDDPACGFRTRNEAAEHAHRTFAHR